SCGHASGDLLAETPAPTGRGSSRLLAPIHLARSLRGRHGWLGQPRHEFLLGKTPEPVTKPNPAQQLLVLVDPAHRDTQRLGDLLDRERAAHQGPPGTATKRGRTPAGGTGPRAGRTTGHRSAS